jgi:hypothetical protein
MKFRDALGIFTDLLPIQSVHLPCLGVGAYPSRRRPRSLAHSPWATRYDVTFPLARSDGTGFWLGFEGRWMPLVQVYYSWVFSLLVIDYFREISYDPLLSKQTIQRRRLKLQEKNKTSWGAAIDAVPSPELGTIFHASTGTQSKLLLWHEYASII